MKFIKNVFKIHRKKWLIAMRVEIGSLQGDAMKEFLREVHDDMSLPSLEKDLNCRIILLPQRQGYGSTVERIM